MSGKSTFIGSASSSFAGRSAAAVTPLQRGKPVAKVPGARAAFIVKAVEGSSENLSTEVDAKGYLKTLQKAAEHVGKWPTEALLLVFDIDETLAESSDTGDRVPLPPHVLEALKKIHGARNRIFIMAATGRTSADAQVAFGNFQVPLVAKDGSWIRFPDGRIEEVEFPPAGEFYKLADKITSDAAARKLDIVKMPELKPAIGLSFSRGVEEIEAFNKNLKEFEAMAKRRRGELAIYTHFYEERIEIIVQNGFATKAEGISKMVNFLETKYNF